MDQLGSQLNRQLLAISNASFNSNLLSSNISLPSLASPFSQLLQLANPTTTTTPPTTTSLEQTNALAALILSQPGLLQSLAALNSAVASSSTSSASISSTSASSIAASKSTLCNEPLTPPISTTDCSNSSSDRNSPVARTTPSPPAHTSSVNPTTSLKSDHVPLDLSIRTVASTQSLLELSSKLANSTNAIVGNNGLFDSVNQGPVSNLFHALEAQLAIAGLNLGSLSPNVSMIDSPPNSEVLSEPDHDPLNASSTSASNELMECAQLSASLLEPEVIISTDPLDDEPTTSGGSQMKRKLDAMLSSEPNETSACNARRQFGQLSLLSPHVTSVSSGHLIVSPPSSSQPVSTPGLLIKTKTPLTISNQIENTPLSAAAIESLSMGASLLLNPIVITTANNGIINTNTSGLTSTANIILNPSITAPTSHYDTTIRVPALPIARSIASPSAVTTITTTANKTKTTTSAKSSVARTKGIKNSAGEFVYPCDLCDQLFSAPDRLNKHKASRHKQRKNNPPQLSIVMDGVDMSTSNASGLLDSQKGFYCTICCRGFSRSDMLTRHFRLHSGLKPYACEICSQVFSRSDHLATHKRTHSGEKPYKCTVCEYAACRRDMITRHMKTHAAR